MTYEQLVKIVRKAIEMLDAETREAKKKEAAPGLRVASFAFDDKNKDLIRRAFASMSAYSGDGPNFVNAENLGALEVCDILFVDTLPSGLIPKLALGIDEAPFSACFNRMILNGCKIFVLKPDSAEGEKTPVAFRALLSGYRQTLKSYGYVFFEFPDGGAISAGKETNHMLKEAKGTDFVFEGRVFCREDLYRVARYAIGGNVVLGKDVRVTPMALDCAKDMNITIVRP